MENGDIVQLEYEGWIAGTDELFDTTSEELAREHDVFEEERSYGPIYTVLGSGKLIKGLDEHIMKAEVGKDYEVELPPEEAYGERDPKNVETHSMREMARLKIEPEIGRTVVIRNKEGWISGIFAGRVRVDFNHKLAGKTLRYKYKVVGQPKTDEERVTAIVAMDYGREDEFEIELEGDDSVSLTLPDVCKFDPRWNLGKLRIVNDLREYTGMVTVVMREVYVKKEAAEEEAAEEEPSEEKEAPEEEPSEEEEAAEEEAAEEKEAPEEEEEAAEEEPSEEKEAPEEEVPEAEEPPEDEEPSD